MAPRSCQLSVITGSSGMWATLKQNVSWLTFFTWHHNFAVSLFKRYIENHSLLILITDRVCTHCVPANTFNVHTHLSGVHTQSHRTRTHIYMQCTASDKGCMQLFKSFKQFTHVCCRRTSTCVLWGETDSLCNHQKSEQCTAGSPAFSLCRGLSCHPPYRSVYSNVKYHRTLEDIVWQFCQGSLEYFFLIAQAEAGRKWLPCEFLTACFLLVGKNNLI